MLGSELVAVMRKPGVMSSTEWRVTHVFTRRAASPGRQIPVARSPVRRRQHPGRSWGRCCHRRSEGPRSYTRRGDRECHDLRRAPRSGGQLDPRAVDGSVRARVPRGFTILEYPQALRWRQSPRNLYRVSGWPRPARNAASSRLRARTAAATCGSSDTISTDRGLLARRMLTPGR
jgi:hypothetical protein